MPPWVPLIPVRMTEAWFLFDEGAVREAAGNPPGQVPLELPALRRAESLPDPKSLLAEALLRATGLSGRRRERFRVLDAKHRLAELIEDFSPLRSLPAFAALERALRAALLRVVER